jgi:hypothetical protein
MFAPERWSQVDRFRRFWPTTYAFGERDLRAVAGVDAHFDKCVRLTSLAEKLRPNLQIDHAQLDEWGVTPADNARELATVIEGAILELYSSVDCTVKVLRAIYGHGTRGFKDSTRSLFQNISNMSGSFPETLRPLIETAPWYWRLLHLRDELTHLATGDVHLKPETGLVWYIHFGLKEGDKPLIIEDIFGWLYEIAAEVNIFHEAVFRHLNGTLADKPVFQICGMVQGRVLHRWLNLAGELTFDSGACGAWIWFEQPGNPTCPFKEACGAFRNKAPPQGWESNTPSPS